MHKHTHIPLISHPPIRASIIETTASPRPFDPNRRLCVVSAAPKAENPQREGRRGTQLGYAVPENQEFRLRRVDGELGLRGFPQGSTPFRRSAEIGFYALEGSADEFGVFADVGCG